MKKAVLLIFTIANFTFNCSFAQEAAKTSGTLAVAAPPAEVKSESTPPPAPKEAAKLEAPTTTVQASQGSSAVSQKAEASPTVAAPPPPQAPPVHQYWTPDEKNAGTDSFETHESHRRFPQREGVSVFALYNFATSVNLTNVTLSNNFQSVTGTGQINTSPAYGLGVQYDVPYISIGLQYEGGRTINSVSVTSQTGQTFYATGFNPTYSYLVPYINGKFDFGKISLFGGFNCNSPSTTGSGSLTGSLGAQAGVSLNATENVSVDAMYEMLRGNFSNQVNGISASEAWDLEGMVLRLRVGF